MIKLLHNLGLRSDVAYMAGLASIGASIATWATSRTQEDAPNEKAERWGIFVGLWAPTWMALGNALKMHESTL